MIYDDTPGAFADNPHAFVTATLENGVESTHEISKACLIKQVRVVVKKRDMTRAIFQLDIDRSALLQGGIGPGFTTELVPSFVGLDAERTAVRLVPFPVEIHCSPGEKLRLRIDFLTPSRPAQWYQIPLWWMRVLWLGLADAVRPPRAHVVIHIRTLT